MTVAQMIAKLQAMPQNLPVAITDWPEGILQPNEIAAEKVDLIEDGQYVSSLACLMTGAFVQIGD